MDMDKRLSIGQRYNVKKGEPWFEDGNIVLLTHEDITAFRMHRGMLARHSVIFNDMLSIPQPSDADLFEGCAVVPMYDSPSELSSLIHCLYDGFSAYSYEGIEDFFFLVGVLRLATKYLIDHIRQQAIRILKKYWPSTLSGHDQMIETALTAPTPNDLTYPYAHPLHVLNLARELDIDILIPMALYFLTIYPLSEILSCNHPKLIFEHSSKPSSILSSQDLQLYTLMYQHRLQMLHSFIRDFCTARARNPPCSSVSTCGKAFSGLVSQLHRSANLKTNPLYEIRRVIHYTLNNVDICNTCQKSFQRDATNLRSSIWENLPSVIGLPPWAQMTA